MANYTATQLLAARMQYSDDFKKPEMRKKPSPVNEALLKNTNFLVPNIESVRASDSRTTSTYILNRAATTAATARSHSHTGSVGDSTLANLTWVTKARKFKHSLKTGDKNEETNQQIFNNRLLSAILDLHEDIETYNLAWLGTSKTTTPYQSSVKNATWDAGNDWFEVLADDRQWFVQYIKSAMKQQKYSGTLDMIIDSAMYAMIEQYSNQGMGNQLNTGFQYSNVNFFETITDLSLGESVYGGGYVFPENTVGLLTWIPSENRNNIKTDLYEYSNIPDPLGSGITFAVHKYETGADNSATYGETQDVDFQYEVSVDISPVAADLSASGESVIYKVAQLT